MQIPAGLVDPPPQRFVCRPVWHKRQQVCHFCPDGVWPGITPLPQPYLHNPSPIFASSITPQWRSWPNPSAHPRQHVVNALPAGVFPGATGLPHPDLQKPSATLRTVFISTLASVSAQASLPSFNFLSAFMRSLSSSCQLIVQPCFAQIFSRRVLSFLCLVWHTSLATCLLQQISPCICASLYFIFPIFELSPSRASSRLIATLIVSTSSASVYWYKTCA
mmetsp:Transcript_48380/g.89077  ORF Transcript_48380/g.89077 Transcript_48380/m.89077 type:complete len:220 (-) Transcript_48380:1339-1998(-)